MPKQKRLSTCFMNQHGMYQGKSILWRSGSGNGSVHMQSINNRQRTAFSRQDLSLRLLLVRIEDHLVQSFYQIWYELGIERHHCPEMMLIVYKAVERMQLPFSSGTSGAGIKAVPSCLSAVIASKPTVGVVPLISPPYIPFTLHNEGFAVWVVNGVATPSDIRSDTHT